MSTNQNVSLVLPAATLTALEWNLPAFLAFLSSVPGTATENVESLLALQASLALTRQPNIILGPQQNIPSVPANSPVLAVPFQLPTPSPSPRKQCRLRTRAFSLSDIDHIRDVTPSLQSHLLFTQPYLFTPQQSSSPAAAISPSLSSNSPGPSVSPQQGLFQNNNMTGDTGSSGSANVNQDGMVAESRAESEEPMVRAPKRKATDSHAGTRPSSKKKKTGSGTTKRKCKPKKKSHLKTAQTTSRIVPLLNAEDPNIPLNGPVDEPQLPNIHVKHMLLDLTRFATDHAALLDLKHLVDDVIVSEDTGLPEISMTGTGSLFDLGQKCHTLDKKSNEYAYMHAVVQLKITTQLQVSFCLLYRKILTWHSRRIEQAKRQFVRNSTAKTKVKDFASEAGVTLREMERWISHGSKLIFWSGTMSPYILLLLASIGGRKYLDTIADNVSGLGLELACKRTSTDPHTQLIKLFIIPLMYDLRAYIGRSSNSLFGFQVGNTMLGFHQTWQITDYLRNVDICWLKNPPPHQMFYDFLHSSDQEHEPVFFFDPLPPSIPLPIQAASTHTLILDDFTLGAELRHAAGAGFSQVTFTNSSSFECGQRKYDDYAYFNTDILEGRRLKICDSEGNTALYVVPGLQDTFPLLNEAIMYKMSILEDDFCYVEDGAVLEHFSATQMIFYNRYGAKGSKDRLDIHPSYNHTIGNTVLRSMQSLPYESNFIQENPEGAKIRDTVFPIVQRVVRYVLSTCHISENNELEITVEHMPFNTSPGAAPFTGYIININVTTDGHIDPSDRNLCVVVPFGDWEDGELVLYQLGLVVDLKPLDILIFPSSRITHFNLRHKGKRGSVVMSTNKEFDSWVENQNGYQGKNFKGKVFKWHNVLVIKE
ncbi:hypothetical protein C8J56DRAFT_1062797 [Mycena floridula]|nr:hypothetical protein C8J56DRAFT_1062797 [Mycena floridula]